MCSWTQIYFLTHFVLTKPNLIEILHQYICKQTMKIVYLAKVWHYGENKSNDKHRNLIKSLQFVVSLNSNLPNRPPLHTASTDRYDSLRHRCVKLKQLYVCHCVCLSVCVPWPHPISRVSLCWWYWSLRYVLQEGSVTQRQLAMDSCYRNQQSGLWPH